MNMDISPVRSSEHPRKMIVPSGHRPASIFTAASVLSIAGSQRRHLFLAGILRLVTGGNEISIVLRHHGN
ncbi:hypothetical protein [Mesorhizobium sp. M0676]|uniref:hypothetical protein n=1 Tax=Mesorhizobium sp. M0676 TaxID=2956984 RepID=UPI003338AF64